MAQLLENVISSNTSVTKIRKLKERNFNSNSPWQLTEIGNVLDALFVQIENENRYISVKKDLEGTSGVQHYSPVRYGVMREDENGEYIEVSYTSQSVSPDPISVSGVEVASFQEKTPLTSEIKYLANSKINTHYYPLSSFTDFYALDDIADFLPLSSDLNTDFRIDLLQSKRQNSKTRRTSTIADESKIDEFNNGINTYFLQTPSYSNKGASSVGEIKNLLFFKNEDLIYVDKADATNYFQFSPWKSCWSNCTANRLDYNYAKAIDGTYIDPQETGDVVFSRDITIEAAGDYWFSFFIKVDSNNKNGSLNYDNVFKTELQISLQKNNTEKACTLFLDSNTQDLGNGKFSTGEAWKRIVASFKNIETGSYTLKIKWPENNSNGYNRKYKIRNQESYTSLQLRIAGLLFEKNSQVSIYDSEYINYLENETLYEQEGYLWLKPTRNKEIKLVSIGENYNYTNESEKDKYLSFNKATLTIVYKRYIEGNNVYDSIGNNCKIEYREGVLFINNEQVDPTTPNRGFRPCVWETVVFYYRNFDSLEHIDIYYPEDTAPRFSWEKDIYNGEISPLLIKTGNEPDTYIHSYLLFGIKTDSINENGITSVEATYPAYYRDLIVLKEQDGQDPKFRRILTDSLFKLKLEQRRRSKEELEEDADLSLITDNIQEGSFTLNKAVTLDNLN